MTADEIITLAKNLGWNIEHAETNKRLVTFARAVHLFGVTHEREEIAAEFERRHKAIEHRNNYFWHAANYVRSRNANSMD